MHAPNTVLNGELRPQSERFAAHLSYARELMSRLGADGTSPGHRARHRWAHRDVNGTVYRLASLQIQTLTGSRWSSASPATVTMTDRHLTLTPASGHLLCMRWSQLTTFTADLTRAELIIDRRGGPRLAVTGAAVPVIAVVGVAALYGAHALQDHPALRLVRDHNPPPQPRQ